MKRHRILFWIAIALVLLVAIIGCALCVKQNTVEQGLHIEVRTDRLDRMSVIDMPTPPIYSGD
jgi:uncharacterized protein YpmB